MAARGKLGLASIGGVLRNHEGQILLSLCKSAGLQDLNEAEVLTISEAFRLCLSYERS